MVNIKTIAKLAGVSPSTVSRVLSGTSYVKQETRETVMKVVKENGYTTNALARGLKQKRSNNICLMMPSIENLIFPSITKGVEDTARKHGYSVTLCNTNEDVSVENAYIDKMRNHWVDGFIFCGITKNDTAYVENLHADGVPLVLVARYNPQDVGVMNIVSIDNFDALYKSTEYLIKTGHKKIAIASGAENLYFYDERLRGYTQALMDNGITPNPELIMREGSDTNSFYKATKELLALHPDIDGICSTSDPKAIVVLRALHDMKIPVPEQISIASLDNVPMSALIEPPLTTVSQPLYEMGVAAATNLIRQILYKEKNGQLPKPIHDVKATEIIVRKSTKIRY